MANGKKIAKQVLRGIGKGFYYFGKGLYIVGRAIGRYIKKEYRNSKERQRIEEKHRRHLREIERESYYAEKGRLRASRTQEPEQVERDAFEEGYQEELGRQQAREELGKQRIRDAEDSRIRNNVLPEFELRSPRYEPRDTASDFLDDVEYARKKRKKNYW